MLDTKESILRLRVVGLSPIQASQIVSLIEKWVLCNGPESAIKRVKGIKINLLRHHAGLEMIPIPGMWLRYRKEGPKGPFGLLFRMKNFRTAWNAIMVYTNLVYHDPETWCTEKQWESMLSAIRRSPVDSSSLIEGLAVVHKSPLRLRIHVEESTGDSLIDYQTRDTKRAPMVTETKTVPEPEALVDSLAVLWHRVVWASRNWDILSGTVKGFEPLIETHMEICLRDELAAGPLLEEEKPLMGNVSLIQEGGYKLRFAANPHRVYQAALQPLGRALFRTLRTVHQDCTFDHDKGVRMVQEWLRQGKPAVSMDLSNATDRAPLDLQLAFLARCGVPARWLQFLRETCQGDWYCNRFKDRRLWGKTRLSWTVGSPLGLYPTFAMFALWHHCVIQAAFAECGWNLQSQELPYVILGDDLVIMDYEVAERVRGWFLSWGMEVADEKSLSSQTLAEFAGRVISSSDVTRGFKWKGVVSDESFVAFAAAFGPNSLILMRPRHKRVLSYIMDLPEPYGLGWNPFGIPLEERLTPLIETVWGRDERFRSFSSWASRTNNALYRSDLVRGWAMYGSVPEFDVADTSDQEAEAVVRAMLPGLESLGAAIWPNLPTVALERGVPQEVSNLYEAMLKRTSSLESRASATTLRILERKIRAVLAHSRV